MNLLHSPTTTTAAAAADSTCSTPYVSAPSSPGHGGPHNTGFFYSAPTSPMHFALTTLPSHSSSTPISHDFEFSSRFGSTGFTSSGSMSSADELFFNGQIRPNTHLEPLLDLEQEEHDDDEEHHSHLVVRGRDLLSFRDKSLRRKARSLSPSRNTTHLEWKENNDNDNDNDDDDDDDGKRGSLEISTESVSASSSRSSSAGRSSKRWVFLKDFLRSKSEGRSNNKFWSTISFSPTKDKKVINQNQDETPKPKVKSQTCSKRVVGKPTNGVGKRRVTSPSPHELHYKANRAQAEELRKKTFLPYKHGLFGCLGFSSKGYGAMSGFARALHTVSSR